jgi:hypothetical protein
VNIIEKGGRLMGDFQINYCALTRTFKKCTYGRARFVDGQLNFVHLIICLLI